MKRQERLWMLGYAALALVCGAVFLFRWWFMLAAFLFGLRLGRLQWKKKNRERKAVEHRQQFQAFLEMIHARLDSGSNIAQALEQALFQMKREFCMEEETDDFSSTLKEAVDRTSSGMSLREAFLHLVREEKDPLTKSFFENLLVGMTQGADLATLAGSYLRLLMEEQELRLDREAKLAGPKREQLLLFSMPIVMLFVMYTTGLASTDYGFMDYAVRVFCIGLFFVAWRWSVHILRDSGLQGKEGEMC